MKEHLLSSLKRKTNKNKIYIVKQYYFCLRQHWVDKQRVFCCFAAKTSKNYPAQVIMINKKPTYVHNSF